MVFDVVLAGLGNSWGQEPRSCLLSPPSAQSFLDAFDLTMHVLCSFQASLSADSGSCLSLGPRNRTEMENRGSGGCQSTTLLVLAACTKPTPRLGRVSN